MFESINFYDKRSIVKELDEEIPEAEIDNYSSRYDKVRNVTYICPCCGTKTRTYLIKVNYGIDIYSTQEDRLDISKEIAYMSSPILEGVEAHCSVCDADRIFIPIDSCIVDSIITLNAMGLETTNSCEGHFDYNLVEAPYIVFKDKDKAKTAFESIPKENPFWLYWELEEDEDSLVIGCNMEKMNVDSFMDRNHLYALELGVKYLFTENKSSDEQTS